MLAQQSRPWNNSYRQQNRMWYCGSQMFICRYGRVGLDASTVCLQRVNERTGSQRGSSAGGKNNEALLRKFESELCLARLWVTRLVPSFHELQITSGLAAVLCLPDWSPWCWARAYMM